MTSSQSSDQWTKTFANDGYAMAKTLPAQCTKETFSAQLKEFYNQVEQLSDSFLTMCQRDNVKVDCKMGCAWCCYQSVFALTHEMLVVADYVRSHFSKGVQKEILNRAKRKTAKTKNLSREALLGTNEACPLLRNGACMVYPVRPVACRIYLSSDVRSCEKRYQKPADITIKPKLFGFMLEAGRHFNYGFVTGLKESGLISNEAPIEWLLVQFMEDKKAFAKWLNGEELHPSYLFEE